MLTLNLTAEEQSVLNAVQEQHLTSFEILKKVDNVSMILSLYNIIDELNNNYSSSIDTILSNFILGSFVISFSK